MNLFEYIGLIAIVSIAIRAIKAISIERYRQKAMNAWERNQREVERIKARNREAWRWE